MKRIDVRIELYEFTELEKEAQEIAIKEHDDFLVDTYGVLNDREEVIENILMNEYLFYKNGKLAHIIQYTGKHPRSGEVVYIQNGEEYLISN